MGKKANAKRRELFERLKQDGRLSNPAIAPKKEPKKRKLKVNVPEPPKCYCFTRFGPLPDSFRRCSDCPEVAKP